MKLLATSLFALAAGCATSPTSPSSPGSSGSPGDPSGAPAPQLALHLTDAPATFDAVNVTISKVEVEAPDGSWQTLDDQSQTFDLLTLQNNATALLGSTELAPGMYGQLRMIVDSASVVIAGAEQPLTIASGAQTGIKIDLDQQLDAGMTYTLVLDYDAGKSVKQTGQGYLMTPVVTVKSFDGAAQQ